MGNCGFTIAPCRSDDRELILKNLTQVEGMFLDALLAGAKTGYETFEEYMALFESGGVVPNVAVYCGHSSIRNWVMGAAATEREATVEKIDAMRELVRQSPRSGAIGFATSTFEGHNGWGGRPMPSRFATKSEFEALVGVLGEEARGLFMLTKGRTTPVEYLERIAAAIGRPAAVAAIQYDHANPDRALEDMRAIGDAVERGRRMVG